MSFRHNPRDPQLVDQIVHEVKSQGVFDEFRKSSIADVDTKPAYQNLRQRVENSVNKFLSEQVWTPETNKIQLREKLRKHIQDSGFLDVGVERIVDQVVNPKISTVFRPRIEEIAYKFLGVPPPEKPENFKPQLLQTLSGLPMNGVGLHVNTDNLLPTDLEQISPESDLKDEPMDLENSDEESPPFELLEEKAKENIAKKVLDETVPDPTSTPIYQGEDSMSNGDFSMLRKNDSINAFNIDPVKDASQSFDANNSLVSQLSRMSDESIGKDLKASIKEEAVIISEEAQMPKFADNLVGAVSNSTAEDFHFDIKKDEIKFIGTERNTGLANTYACVDENKESSFSGKEAEFLADQIKNEPQSDFANADSTIILEKNRPRKKSTEQHASLSNEDSRSTQTLYIDEKATESSFPDQNSHDATTEKPSPDLVESQEVNVASKTSSNSSQNKLLKEKSHVHKDSKKEKDRDRERDRDRDKERLKDKNRQQRDRDRGRDKERDREKEKYKERDNHKGRDKDKSKERKKVTENSRDSDRHRDRNDDHKHHKSSDRHSSGSSRSKHHSSSSSHRHSKSSFHKSSKSEKEYHSSSKTHTSTSNSSCSRADDKRDKEKRSQDRNKDRLILEKHSNRERKPDEKHGRKTSTSTKNEASQKSKTSDDHYENKVKTNRREFNDSNDEDDRGYEKKTDGSNESKEDSKCQLKPSSEDVTTEQNGKSIENKSREKNDFIHETVAISKDSLEEEEYTGSASEEKNLQVEGSKSIDETEVGNDTLPKNYDSAQLVVEKDKSAELLGMESPELNCLPTTHNHQDTMVGRKGEGCYLPDMKLTKSGTDSEKTVNEEQILNREFCEYRKSDLKCPLTKDKNDKTDLLDDEEDFFGFESDTSEKRAMSKLLPRLNKARKALLKEHSEKTKNLPQEAATKETKSSFSNDDKQTVTCNREEQQTSMHSKAKIKKLSDDDCRVKESIPKTQSPKVDFHDCKTKPKTSPTPSDSSINSKENEQVDKNSGEKKESKIKTRSSKKLTQQQRYTSEDLYKPRPVLSQRTRRHNPLK